jgi:hypothetical protein
MALELQARRKLDGWPDNMANGNNKIKSIIESRRRRFRGGVPRSTFSNIEDEPSAASCLQVYKTQPSLARRSWRRTRVCA